MRYTSRFQAVAGSAGRETGYGRPLPQGGFQSIDRQYAAEAQCKIPPQGTPNVVSEYGGGVEDVAEWPDNPTEDTTQDDTGVLSTTADNETTTVVISNNETTQEKKKSEAPKLSTENKLQLDDDFHEE